MASIGNSYRMVGAINFNTGGGAGIYTCPADRWAIVNLAVDSTGQTVLSIGGQNYCGVGWTAGAKFIMNGVYVGPGQTISVTGGVVRGNGVEFANT